MKKRLLPIIAFMIIILSFNKPVPGGAEEVAQEGSELAAEEVSEGNGGPLDFSPGTYSLGGFPRATTLLDIDSDGHLDIVVTNPEKHNITILLNRGDGTFEPKKDYPIDGYPISIISTDIDGDSKTDLVVLDSEGKVRTFFNTGEGTLSAGRTYPVVVYSFSISASDVNQDGAIDLIVLSAETHTVLLNDGKGGFDTILAYPGGVNAPTKITADLNADSRSDMILGDKEGVSVLLNNGDETFSSGTGYATGKRPVAAAMGDLDSDQEADLVVANYVGNTISILKSNGDGTFQEAINYPSGKGPNSITLGDIDGDEDMDIIVTNGLSRDVTVFINNTVRPLEVITDSLPQGRRGTSYITTLEAKGGAPPYNWTVISGSLPPTLHLNPETGEMFSLDKHNGEAEAPQDVAAGFSLRPKSGNKTPGKGNDEEEGARDEKGEDQGEPLPSLDPPCFCLKAPAGLYRFTVRVADSASHSTTADLNIEVLPQPGTISGMISYPGEKKGKIWIGLWPVSRARTIESFTSPMYSTTMTTPGEYKIENIYSESYLAGAYLDVNGNGIREKDEPYGTFLLKGPEGKPEAVVVNGNGEEVTGIDIELVDSTIKN